MESRSHPRGVALLGVVILLMFLAFLALAFVVLQRTEREVSRTRIYRVRAKLLARSGMEYAACRISRNPAAVARTAWTDANAIDDWSSRDDISTPIRDLDNPSYVAGEPWTDDEASPDPDAGRWDATDTYTDLDVNGVRNAWSGRLRGGGGSYSDTFTLRIADANALINVNAGNVSTNNLNANGEDPPGSGDPAYSSGNPPLPDHRDVTDHGNQALIRLLDNLGAILDVSSTTGNGTESEISTLGDTLVRNRPPGGWPTIESLRAALSQADYVKVRDFLTVDSWVDPTTVVVRGPNNDTSVGWVLFRGYRTYDWRPEPRPPITINSAPREVLEAALRHVGAVIHVPLWETKVKDFRVEPAEAEALADEILATRIRAEEPFTDSNDNGVYDSGEAYTDLDGNGKYDFGTFESWPEFFAFLHDRKSIFDTGDPGWSAPEQEVFRNLQAEAVYANARPDWERLDYGTRSYLSLDLDRESSANQLGFDRTTPRRLRKNFLAREYNNLTDPPTTASPPFPPPGQFHYESTRTTDFSFEATTTFRVDCLGTVISGASFIEADAEASGVYRTGEPFRVTRQEDFENLTFEPVPKGTGAARQLTTEPPPRGHAGAPIEVWGAPTDPVTAAAGDPGGWQSYPKFSQRSFSPANLDATYSAPHYGYALYAGEIRMAKRSWQEGADYGAGNEDFLAAWSDDEWQRSPAADPDTFLEHITDEIGGDVQLLGTCGHGAGANPPWAGLHPAYQGSFTHAVDGDYVFGWRTANGLFPCGRTGYTYGHEFPDTTFPPLADAASEMKNGTIECWIQSDGQRGMWGQIVMIADNAPNPSGPIGHVISVHDDRLFFNGYPVSFYTNVSVPLPPPVDDDGWRHVAIRFGTVPTGNGENYEGQDVWEVYIDGTRITAMDMDFAPSSTSYNGAWIYGHGSHNSSNEARQGYLSRTSFIDDLRIYDELIPESLIAQHAQNRDLYVNDSIAGTYDGTYLSPEYRFDSERRIEAASWDGFVPAAIRSASGGIRVSLLLYDESTVTADLTTETPAASPDATHVFPLNDMEEIAIGENARSFRFQVEFDGGSTLYLKDTPIFSAFNIRHRTDADSGGVWTSTEEFSGATPPRGTLPAAGGTPATPTEYDPGAQSEPGGPAPPSTS